MAEVEFVAEDGFDPDPDHLKWVIKSNSDLTTRFRDITQIDERRIMEFMEICSLHERAKVPPTAGFTIFCRYFFSKYVSIRQGVDARSGRMDQHASIFPFKTNSNLPVSRVAVAELFKDPFLSEIRKFVDDHFGHEAFDFEHLKDLFLTNIQHFKEQLPHSPSLKQLTSLIGLGSNSWRRGKAPKLFRDHFDDHVRLSDAGVVWYKYFQTQFNDVCHLYRREGLQLPEKSNFYFKYLPEINCCELLLLLEVDFFHEHLRKYTEIFSKYLFFFAHAIRRGGAHPVAFVDEALFACLQSKRKYETFRGDILQLQWELWMITLVHRRKYKLLDRRQRSLCYTLDVDTLTQMVSYVDRIPNIDSAVVYYGEPRYSRFKLFLVFDDVAFLVGYSERSKENGLKLNRGQILKSALLSRDINTLVHYNAYLGVETRLPMPRNKDGICRFIRELTEEHPPERSYPERFIVHNLEKYFQTLPPAARV